jgi:hypothetical protein
MDGQSHFHLKDAHAAWNDANQQVRACERMLAAALSEYEAGKGPLPADLLAQVEALRRDCNAKFKALMTAMKNESADVSSRGAQ